MFTASLSFSNIQKLKMGEPPSPHFTIYSKFTLKLFHSVFSNRVEKLVDVLILPKTQWLLQFRPSSKDDMLSHIPAELQTFESIASWAVHKVVLS